MVFPLSAHWPSHNTASVGELPFAWRAASPGDYAKWSALRYGFRAKEDHDGEEETQARGDCCEAAPGGCAGVAGAERALPTRYARLGLRRSRTTAGARSLAGSRATRSSD